LVNPATPINFQTVDKDTSLICASQRGHIEVVKQLLTIPKIDISMENKDGETALDLALKHNHREIVDLIQKYAETSS
jgi:ankyrin repeat protein